MQETRAHDKPAEGNGTTSGRRKVDLAAVRELVEPVVVAHGLDLVEVEWQSTHHGQVLRIVIERPMDDDEPDETPEEPTDAVALTPIAGVGLEDCVAVSRDLSTVLDVEGEDVAGLPEGRYNLEVSSPGLDRPLRTARDFRRQMGRLAKVKLIEPAADGQRVLRGTIVSVASAEDASTDETRIQIDVDGKPHQVRLDNIDVAKLVFELPQQPKPRSSSKQKGQRGKAKKGRSKRGGAK